MKPGSSSSCPHDEQLFTAIPGDRSGGSARPPGFWSELRDLPGERRDLLVDELRRSVAGRHDDHQLDAELRVRLQLAGSAVRDLAADVGGLLDLVVVAT